jgi:hypothetical protein
MNHLSGWTFAPTYSLAGADGFRNMFRVSPNCEADPEADFSSHCWLCTSGTSPTATVDRECCGSGDATTHRAHYLKNHNISPINDWRDRAKSYSSKT